MGLTFILLTSQSLFWATVTIVNTLSSKSKKVIERSLFFSHRKSRGVSLGLLSWGCLQGTRSLLSPCCLYASDLTPSHNMAAMSLCITDAFQEKRREGAKVKSLSERHHLFIQEGRPQRLQPVFHWPALVAKKARNLIVVFQPLQSKRQGKSVGWVLSKPYLNSTYTK